MSTFQLTVSDKYVPNWTYIEGLRELFQNAIDYSAIDPENKMYFEYIEEDEKLLIGNKKSILSRESLLFGYSTKRGDDRTIGSHGEGYKIAILVLLREGKEVTFHNKGVGEVWTTRLLKSKKYNSVIPEIKVTKKVFTKKDIDSNLVIEVANITKSEYSDFSDNVLQLRGYGEHIDTTRGKLLLDSDLKGKVFVNGLYVSFDKDLVYGYDLKPDKIELDRDRRLIADFELTRETSAILGLCGDDTLIAECISDKAKDAKWIAEGYTSLFINNDSSLREKIVELRQRDTNSKEYPVSTNEDIAELDGATGIRPLLVTPYERDILRESGMFYKPVKEKKTISARLESWFDRNKSNLDDSEKSEFLTILSDLKISEAR